MRSQGRASCSWPASRTERGLSSTDRTWTDANGRRKTEHIDACARLAEAPTPSSRGKLNSTPSVASGSSTHRQVLNDRPCCSPSAPKRSDLVLFVAPLCIKELRLVTARVPEKSSPFFGPGLNQLPLLRVLRSSATERSRKLTAYGVMLDPPRRVPPARRGGACSGNLKLNGDRMVVARFLSLLPLPDLSAVEYQHGQRAEVDETHIQLVVF